MEGTGACSARLFAIGYGSQNVLAKCGFNLANNLATFFKTIYSLKKLGYKNYILLTNVSMGSGCGSFQYQRTQVQIQSLATFNEHLFTVNCL